MCHKFLGVHIPEGLSWFLNTSALMKKAQCLFFLRRLKKTQLSPGELSQHHRENTNQLCQCGLVTAPLRTGKHCRGRRKWPNATAVPHSPPSRMSRESEACVKRAASQRTFLTTTIDCLPSSPLESASGLSAPGPAGSSRLYLL